MVDQDATGDVCLVDPHTHNKGNNMTTKITIKHEGPDHRNVKVIDNYSAAPEHIKATVLKTGQSIELHVYEGRSVEVSETDAPATNA